MLAAGLALSVWAVRSASQGEPGFHVLPEPAQRQARPLGINLGAPTAWGAEQLLANVLSNPGFEGNVDGAVIRVRTVEGRSVVDDSQGLARPAGFWDGGAFSVRTGRLAGMAGRIVASDGPGGFQRIELDADAASIAPGDVLAVRRISAGGLPAHWWYQNSGGGQVRTDTSIRRPRGAGRQSLLLAPAGEEPAGVVSYLDALPDRAGKLLPLRGEWRLGVWVRGSGPAPELRVTLRRQGSPLMFEERVPASAGWKWREWRFTPEDDGSPGLLEFRLEASGGGNQIWLDDVSLRPSAAGVSGFRPEVTATLLALHPGYLRDWQGQLGDSFENRIARPDARLCSRYRPGADSELFYGYSLPEFLALCHETGAAPWIVAPTTWSDEEWRQAGELLGSAWRRFGFTEMVVEFGNENWNQLFRPAGVPNAPAMAAAARRGFELMRAGANGAPLSFALGGWFGNNTYLADAAPGATLASVHAVAPYYAQSLPAGTSAAGLLPLLFPDDRVAFAAFARQAAANRAEPAFYEMNAHSLGGDAALEDVSAVVTSAASGAALLYRALHALDAGVRRQCLYSLGGFDTFRWTDGKPVRLFGMTRDLATASRFRPTGLAMAMANEVIAGDYHRVVDSGDGAPDGIAIAAFHDGLKWSLVAASSLSHESQITVRFPPGGRLPRVVKTMVAPDPLADNEGVEAVNVLASGAEGRAGALLLRVPAYGVVVALP